MAEIDQAAARGDQNGPLTDRPGYSLTALALSTLFVLSIPIAIWMYVTQHPGVDFVSFWAAGRLVLAGHPASAYDIAIHRAVELTATGLSGLMPFPYPPPFLFAVSLVALKPFWLGYLVWIVVTAGLYLAATRRLVPPRFAFAHPAALVNFMIGQNGFLTSAIFLCGIGLVAGEPFVGGLVLGLLVIKPQLGVLIPVALLASRNWRAIGGAAFSSLALLLAAWAVFGTETYRAFAGISHQYAVFIDRYPWDWGEQASVFAFLRFFGINETVALSIQLVSAFGAAIVTWRAWAENWASRGAILAAATILVPPYLFTYDSLILTLPAACLLRNSSKPWRPAIVWLLLLLPLVPLFGFHAIYPGPNTVPIAAILCLWWLSSGESRRGIGQLGRAASS